MMQVLDFLDLVNVIDRVDYLIALVRYRDLTQMRVAHSNKRGFCGQAYEDTLKKYGVRMFGRRITGKFVVFYVKTSQARWAEYLLQRQGAPLVSVFDPRNRTWSSGHPAGSLPDAWADRGQKGGGR